MRLLFACLLCGPLFGADLTGIWIGQIPGRNGTMNDVAFKFTQSGTALSGKQYGEYQSTPISDGKVTGDQVAFLLVTPEQSGNQINTTRIRFTGVMKDGEIEITREREGATTSGNGGAVEFKGNAKQTFRLKRLL